MKDIETRKDLEYLLSEFYEVAMEDSEIGHHFVDLDLESHLPIIVDFWEKILFGKPIYFGNPLVVHKQLHDKSALKSAHFERWVEIFQGKVDESFVGETAEKAKVRAKMIAANLSQRLNEPFDKIGHVQIKK